MAQRFAKAFYNSKDWQQVRLAVLARDYYVCQECGKTDCNTVHHIIPLTEANINNTDISVNMDNLETICKDCHDKVHGRYQARNELSSKVYTYDSQGHIVRA